MINDDYWIIGLVVYYFTNMFHQVKSYCSYYVQLIILYYCFSPFLLNRNFDVDSLHTI